MWVFCWVLELVFGMFLLVEPKYLAGCLGGRSVEGNTKLNYLNFFFPLIDTPLTLEIGNTEKETSLEETKIGEILIQGLTEDMVTVLIRACVSMLGVPVDPDTLHATLRLCLRLTRDHKYAMMFAELKSTRMILNLTQSSGFNGFTPLVTLLLRHIIEDPCTLRHTMEKVSLFGVQCSSL
jgi:hypothetical protein